MSLKEEKDMTYRESGIRETLITEVATEIGG